MDLRHLYGSETQPNFSPPKSDLCLFTPKERTSCALLLLLAKERDGAG